ncbi:hypothetical protein B0H17DRAFT_1214950 [Mycena rosella]|uniref:Uncharacterized protein n=1 Tax=Mycena rosella TaxID=1033263 RepID=A0AAD7G2F6_MYCRO|nr:hypothetical protein B0H17DRAFT_1214950 [Mycena rosella]
MATINISSIRAPPSPDTAHDRARSRWHDMSYYYLVRACIRHPMRMRAPWHLEALLVSFPVLRTARPPPRRVRDPLLLLHAVHLISAAVRKAGMHFIFRRVCAPPCTHTATLVACSSATLNLMRSRHTLHLSARACAAMHPHGDAARVSSAEWCDLRTRSRPIDAEAVRGTVLFSARRHPGSTTREPEKLNSVWIYGLRNCAYLRYVAAFLLPPPARISSARSWVRCALCVPHPRWVLGSSLLPSSSFSLCTRLHPTARRCVRYAICAMRCACHIDTPPHYADSLTTRRSTTTEESSHRTTQDMVPEVAVRSLFRNALQKFSRKATTKPQLMSTAAEPFLPHIPAGPSRSTVFAGRRMQPSRTWPARDNGIPQAIPHLQSDSCELSSAARWGIYSTYP